MNRFYITVETNVCSLEEEERTYVRLMDCIRLTNTCSFIAGGRTYVRSVDPGVSRSARADKKVIPGFKKVIDNIY